MSEPNLSVSPELGRLSTFIGSRVECLAGSSSELRSIALSAAKHIFDWALETEESSNPHLGTLLATLTEAAPPRTRSRVHSASTQRPSPSPLRKPPKKIVIGDTPLSSLFVEGMNTDQIWQQLDLRAARVCENLQALQGDNEDEDEEAITAEEDSDVDESEDEGEGDVVEVDMDDAENMWEELSGGEEDGSSTGEDVVSLREETSEDDQDHEPPTSMLDVVCGHQKLNPSRSYSQDHSDLDDRFFDLATFNAETREVEPKNSSKRKLDFVADEDSAEESEVDIFGALDGAETGITDGHELFYNDFFEPPPRIQNKSIRSSKVRFHERVAVKKIKLVGKGMPVSSMCDEDSDEEEENDIGGSDSD